VRRSEKNGSSTRVAGRKGRGAGGGGRRGGGGGGGGVVSVGWSQNISTEV